MIDVSFKDVNADDDRKLCKDWLIVYGFSQSLVYTTSVITVIINMIIGIVLRAIVEWEGHHT